MYGFVDVIDRQGSETLPSEAFSYNGKWIDNEVPGFKTLNVAGRELMGKDIREQSITGVDGSTYLSRNFPTRKIIVKYSLSAPNAAEFRDRFNKLMSLLEPDQAKIIFADEADKYFIGTAYGSGNPDPGRLSTVGEIEIHCTDPFKYSSTLKLFESSNEVLKIQNSGFPCGIEFEATNTQENGFISLVSEDGAIELGCREEKNGETYKQAEVVLSQEDFYTTENQVGIDYLHPTYVINGHLGKIEVGTDLPREDGKTSPVDWLFLGGYGTGSGWHGGGKVVSLKADSSGHIGAKNFDVYLYHWFHKANPNNIGEQTVNFLTADNKVILSINIYSDVSGSFSSTIEWWANGIQRQQFKFDARGYDHGHMANAFGSGSNGHNMIRKEGSKVTYYYWGQYYTLIIPEIENMECTKVQVCMKQFASSDYMVRNYIRDFRMTKLDVEGYQDIKNRFPAGSVIRIKEGKPYVNGMYKPEEEVLGSTYFKARSGETKVLISGSDWSTAPKVKAWIRERWL